MKNKVTFEAIGILFFTYLKSKKELTKFDYNLIKVSMFDGLTLYPYNGDSFLTTIIKTCEKGHICYVSDIKPSTQYFTIDSCNKIKGYDSVLDLDINSNVCLRVDKLGRNLIKEFSKTFIDDLTCDEEREIVDMIFNYLRESIVEMTKDYMGAGSVYVPDKWIEDCWGFNNENTDKIDIIHSFKHLFEWENCEDYIDEYLNENAIHAAIDNVIGDSVVTDAKYMEIRDTISCEHWSDIFALARGNEEDIKTIQKELGIYKSNGISLDLLKDMIKSLKLGESINFYANEDYDYIFTFSKSRISDWEYFVLMANELGVGDAKLYQKLDDIDMESIREIIEPHADFEGEFFIR